MTLFGLKTEAFLDVWSIEHILFGMSVGGIVMFINKKHKAKLASKLNILMILLLAYFWESIEVYLELGAAGDGVKYWFYGVEHWSNRIISDPLMMIIGYYIVRRVPKICNISRVLSCAWLFVHIIIFPHSMYLHELMNNTVEVSYDEDSKIEINK
jgi:hypothetical protein